MKRQLRIFVGFFCVFTLILVFMAPMAFSDKVLEIKKFKVNKVNTHQLTKGPRGPGKGQEWSELTVTFYSKPKWVNEVTIKYFVLMKGKEGNILSGEVTYVNVPSGKNVSSLFMHYTTLARYGKIEAVHCELWAKGAVRDKNDWPKKPGKKWWEMKAPVKGLLMNKLQTPFIVASKYLGLSIKVE